MEPCKPHLLLYSVRGCFDGAFCLSANMPERVWGELPAELLERVLAKLPTTSLLRFRAVCKAWRSLFASSRFHQLAASRGGPLPATAPVLSYQLNIGPSSAHLQPHPTHPLASTAGGVVSPSCEVRKVDLSFLPAQVLALGWEGCVVQDGVLCMFETTASNCLTQIYMVNPMTRSWRALRLPASVTRRQMEDWFVKFWIADSSSSSFKVVVAWECFMSWGFATYSSASDSWTLSPGGGLGLAPGVLHAPRLRPPRERGPSCLQVLSGNLLFVYQSNGSLIEPLAAEYEPDVTSHAITSYCLETGVANQFVLNRVDFAFHTRDLFLVEHQKTVYFVVGHACAGQPSPVLSIGQFTHRAANPWAQLSMYWLADLSTKLLPRAKASFDNCEEFMGVGGAVALGDSIWISVGVSGEWHVLEFRIPDLSWHAVLRGPLRDSYYSLWLMANNLVQPRVDLKL